MKYLKWVVGGLLAIPVIFWGVVGALSNMDTFIQWASGESPTQTLLATLDPLRLAGVAFALGGLFGLVIGSFGERFRARADGAQLADLAESNRQLRANIDALAQGPVLRMAFDAADRRCNVQKGGSGFINVRVENGGSHAAQGCAVVLESLSLNGMEQDFPQGRRFRVADGVDPAETFSVSAKSREYVRLVYQHDHASHGGVFQVCLPGAKDVPPHGSVEILLRLDGPREAVFHRMRLEPDPARRGWMRVGAQGPVDPGENPVS